MKPVPCIIALALLAHACGNETKATRAVVEISSDIKDLTSVQIEVSDGQPEGSTKTATFPVAADRNSNFLLSFAIAPSPGHEDGTFSVIATGLDADGVFLVQQRQAGSFAPKAFRTIKVWLGQLCQGVVCTDPGETCSDSVLVNGKGQCAPLGTGHSDAQEPSQADASATPDASGAKDAEPDLDSRTEAAIPVDAGVDDAPVAVVSQTCDQEDAIRCVMSGTPLRQRCRDGRWVDNEPCAESEVCDPSATDAGACRAPLEMCKGSAGQAVCDGATMFLCNASGGADSTQPCQSERLCAAGIKSRKCAACDPGIFRCDGAKLQVCSDDGQGFTVSMQCSSASLCNAESRACTDAACLAGTKTCAGDLLRVCKDDQSGYEDEQMCDLGMCDTVGKECDICTPGVRSCVGNSVVTCNPGGQDYATTPCTAAKPLCTENGVCVQCTVPGDCPGPSNECTNSSCNTATGTCGSTPKTAHTACSVGVCNGSGTCTGCVDNSDCTTPGLPACAGGTCVECTTDANCAGAMPRCVSTRCVQCKTATDCDASKNESCQSGVCVVGPYCGDGRVTSGEQCDYSAPGWDSFSCSETCRSRLLYNSCDSNAECSAASVGCGLGYCWYGCSADTDCPASPTLSHLHPYCLMAQGCVLADCTSDSDCPSGVPCRMGGGRLYCEGCSSTTQCPSGESCVIPSGRSIGRCK